MALPLLRNLPLHGPTISAVYLLSATNAILAWDTENRALNFPKNR